MNTDTEFGRRLKELNDSKDVEVTIRINASGDSDATPKSWDNATNGEGSDTIVNININDTGFLKGESTRKDPVASLVHEVAGHAYDNYRGVSPYNGSIGTGKGTWPGLLKYEQNAVAMENEYRSFKRVASKTFLFLFTVSFLFCCTKEDKTLQGGETVQNVEKEQEDKIIFGNFIRKDSSSLILNLPYEIEDGIDYVFDKDTPMAIDIIEIYADGENLFFIDDHTEPGPFGSIQKYPIKKDKKEYFISMKWRMRGGGWITWNDGRGLYFEKDVPWIVAPNIDTYTPKTNTYALSSGMKQLVIRYRILFPYLSLSTDDLYHKTHIGKFSNEKIIIVDISNILEL